VERVTKAVLIATASVWLWVFWANSARAQALDPIVDYRYAGEVVRDADGSIHRSTKVINAFKKIWACPSTGLHKGPCPGWAIDHVISLPVEAVTLCSIWPGCPTMPSPARLTTARTGGSAACTAATT